MTEKDENVLLKAMVDLCENLAFGRKADENALFNLTRQGVAPDHFARLAEAFGMMLVKVEAREFHRNELIANLQAKNKELEEMYRKATTDALTGAHNRLYFMEIAAMRLRECQRKAKPFALGLFDLDKFKSVNDSYGHPAGDAVLCSTVDLVHKLLRPYDLFARYGGEEFVLFLPDSDEKSAMEIAERIRSSMENHTTCYNDTVISRTLSIGLATDLSGAEDLEALISAADAALYQAKNKGRNQVVMADRPTK